ncbi:maleylpyruvate isomerase family mycothiol-dependent enzyme [Nocardioides ultimimeridianus]
MGGMTPAEQHAYDAARFTHLVESAHHGDWDNPSPCAGWTARDVVAHLIEWLPGFLERARVTLEPVDLDHLEHAWRHRCDEVQDVLERRSEETFESPMFGTMTIGAAIDRFYTNDVWMHSWDLAKALGHDFDLDEDRCAAALTAMEPMDAALRQGDQFGARVEVPADASAQDRFLGFIGRDPHWQA